MFCFQLFYSLFHASLAALHALNPRSVIATLVLQTETRMGKCPAPTDSCHAMPVHSAGAQPLRRADVALSSAPQPLAPSRPSMEQGMEDVATLAMALWFLGHGPCKAQLWLDWRCAHSITPALCPGQRGLEEPHRWDTTCMAPASCPGMGQLRRTVALEVLLHYLPKFLSYICTCAFLDTATSG